jgi:hypothetical protein
MAGFEAASAEVCGRMGRRRLGGALHEVTGHRIAVAVTTTVSIREIQVGFVLIDCDIANTQVYFSRYADWGRARSSFSDSSLERESIYH